MSERDVAKKPDPAAGTRSATKSKRSTTARSTPDGASIYQLKVTLQGAPAGTRGQLPGCLGGERACPPEACGGAWGYADLLRALEAPDDPRWAELLDWGAPFDPEKVGLDAVNARLAKLGARRRRSRNR